MVEIGQPAIRAVDFQSRLHPRLPVEVIDRSELVTRVDSSLLAMPERLSFPAMMLMRSPSGVHTVDFAPIPSRRGRLVQLRPGQVQVWDLASDQDATLVLAQPATASGQPWFPGHSPYRDLDEAQLETAESLIDAARRHQARFDGEEPMRRLLVSIFEVMVALFDSVDDGFEGPLPNTYLAFRRAVENEFMRHHDVVHYGRTLGYSARTLTRACQQATGQTAKAVLTDRIVLEAKRLLVHTDQTSSSISASLGFTEPTNFSKFFARSTGHTPAQFRLLSRTDQ